MANGWDNERVTIHRNRAVLADPTILETWTDKELLQGFQGSTPGKENRVVPRACHEELMRRRFIRAQDLFRNNLLDAAEVLVEVIKDEHIETKDRLRAIGMLFDRVLGKVPQRVEMSGDVPAFIVALRAGIVAIDPVGDEDDIIDAELIEELDNG